MKKIEKYETLVRLIETNPRVSLTTVQKALKCSRATAYRLADEVAVNYQVSLSQGWLFRDGDMLQRKAQMEG